MSYYNRPNQFAVTFQNMISNEVEFLEKQGIDGVYSDIRKKFRQIIDRHENPGDYKILIETYTNNPDTIDAEREEIKYFAENEWKYVSVR